MSETHKRLPTFERAEEPPGFRLTRRDQKMLETIHAFGGMMADYQIERLFFSARRRAQARLSLLFHHGFVARPDRRRRAALPCMVYWLGRRGAEYLAGLGGQDLVDFDWRDELKKIGVEHDLAVNNFHLDVLRACTAQPKLQLQEWVGETEFRAEPDTVEYRLPNGKKRKRKIIPDAFFVIREPSGYTSRLLLEIDMATEDNPRFSREKVLPGVAYLRSREYRQRFGYKSGRWLVVTTSESRLGNMKRKAEEVAGKDAAVFYFTTFPQVTPATVLTSPIWYRGGESRPRPLFSR